MPLITHSHPPVTSLKQARTQSIKRQHSVHTTEDPTGRIGGSHNRNRLPAFKASDQLTAHLDSLVQLPTDDWIFMVSPRPKHIADAGRPSPLSSPRRVDLRPLASQDRTLPEGMITQSARTHGRCTYTINIGEDPHQQPTRIRDSAECDILNSGNMLKSCNITTLMNSPRKMSPHLTTQEELRQHNTPEERPL